MRGNEIVVDHGDGTQGIYYHLWEIDVAVGDRVVAGQRIGEAGASGCATGCHLHFQVDAADGTPVPFAFDGVVPVPGRRYRSKTGAPGG